MFEEEALSSNINQVLLSKHLNRFNKILADF